MGEFGEAPGWRFWLSAANEISLVGRLLLPSLDLRWIGDRRIVGDRDVGYAPGTGRAFAQNGILERRPRRLDGHNRLTRFGRASAISQPKGPDCECVRIIAGPMRSNRAAPAAWFRPVVPVYPPGAPTTFAPATVQDLVFPFPDAATTNDQTFRSIIKPDLWGNTMRSASPTPSAVRP